MAVCSVNNNDGCKEEERLPKGTPLFQNQCDSSLWLESMTDIHLPTYRYPQSYTISRWSFSFFVSTVSPCPPTDM
jgi:hypothetical protein